jgi:hypothetical protein
MSISPEKVAPLLTPTKRKRVRPYKARVATKVKWALGDTLERTIRAQRRMRNVFDWIEETRELQGMDTRVLARLGTLDHELLALEIEIAEMIRIVTVAIAESKPERVATPPVPSKTTK